jgi:hypothetical protein
MAEAAADKHGEAGLWAAHLAVLRQALRLRQPDAPARIRSEAARIGREVEALSERRNLARRRERWAADATAVPGGHDDLDSQIAIRLKRVSDLMGLLRLHALPARGDRGDTGDTKATGGTAEALARPAQTDPITMLLGKGKLTEDQVRAAREIAWVHEAMTRSGRARVSRMSQIDPPAGWQEVPLPERAAFIHAKRFRPWAEALGRESRVDLDIVLRIAVMGLSVYAVARHHQLGWNPCVRRLAAGLARYWRKDAS